MGPGCKDFGKPGIMVWYGMVGIWPLAVVLVRNVSRINLNGSFMFITRATDTSSSRSCEIETTV